tara:strand:- start:31716 stop:32066 length:351 start_codon:yes stop_codon:yes gene_type:complete
MITQTRVIIGLIIAALVVAALVFAPAMISKIMTQKKQIRVEQGQAEAGTQTGEAVLDELGKKAAADAEIDKSVEEATAEIDKAPAGFSNDAALRASCALQTYKNTAKCRELRGEAP